MTRHEAIYVLKKHKVSVNTKTATSKWLITAAEWYESRSRRRIRDRRRALAYWGAD